MEQKPLISVITPAFEVHQYIEEAMVSVLEQDYEHFEYVVVDDGSSDGTVEVARKVAERDSRIRVIATEHLGSSNARNVALEQIDGSFVAFLDGDDRWHPDFLSNNLDLLVSLPAEVAAVFCRPRVISAAGRPYLLRWEPSGGYDFDAMLVGACPPKCGSSLLLKREAFAKLDGFSTELSSAVDLDMWLRIQNESDYKIFWANPRYLMDQRVRAGAISRDHGRRFEALDELLAEHAPNMHRIPSGAAYVRPTVFAFRAGDETFAIRWRKQAMSAGFLWLLRDGYGRRMLMWSVAGTALRGRIRNLNNAMRKFAGKLLGSASALER